MHVVADVGDDHDAHDNDDNDGHADYDGEKEKDKE